MKNGTTQKKIAAPVHLRYWEARNEVGPPSLGCRTEHTLQFNSTVSKLNEWNNAGFDEKRQWFDAWVCHESTPEWTAFFKGFNVGTGKKFKWETKNYWGFGPVLRGYFEAGILAGKDWKAPSNNEGATA